MPWKSLGDMSVWLDSIPYREALETAFELQVMLSGAVAVPEYSAVPAWADAVVLTGAGEELIRSTDGLGDMTKSDLMMAMYKLFYYQDLLIDVERSNTQTIRSVLQDDLFAVRLRWPYRFGRFLYDRYNDLEHSNETDHLEFDRVDELLRDTPQGVYQMGSLVTGPLGYLTSRENRYIPPSRYLPLWHCSDTGCSSLHTVYLAAPKIDTETAFRELKRAAESIWGRPSEWLPPLRQLHRGNAWPNGRPYYDLPAVIGDTILGSERRALLARVLGTEHSRFLRGVLSAPPRRRSGGEESPEQLVEKLTEEEQLQLLLLLTDAELVQVLDLSLRSRVISVPAHEVRRPVMQPPPVSRLDLQAEVSSLGLRARRERPFVFFFLTIWDTYEAHGLLNELGWRLKKRSGEPGRDDLLDFLRTTEPGEAVEHLVLSSMPVTQAIAERVDLELGEGGTNRELAERLLWKFGFSTPRFSPEYSLLRARLRNFHETLLRIGAVRTETDREVIRSSGVNLFVSIEQFLEELVAYNVWVLSSDHFLETRFNYDPADAVARVCGVLGAELRINQSSFLWNCNGGNTLGTSMVFLERVSTW